MSLYEAIQEYEEAEKRQREVETTTVNKLKECILHALLDRGLGHLEETSVAIVNGREIVFTAHICRDSDNLTSPLTVDDIELGGHIGQDSLIFLC